MIRATLVAALALPACLVMAEEPQQRQLIFGGEQTILDRYPYYTDVEPDRDLACGGVLVAPDMVLTHPLCSPLKLTAKIGWYNELDETTMNILNIRNTSDALIVHPLYNDATFEYGFLLVQLDGTSTKAVPQLNNDPDEPAAETALNVVGRGNRKPGGFNRQKKLDEAPLPFVDTDTCERVKSHGGQTYQDMIQESMFCAGSDEYSTCEDDWGGPLVVRGSSPSQDVVVGITAWTFGCGPPTPGVFSRVSSAYDWLRWTICQNSVAAPAYLDCGSAVEPTITPPQSPPTPPDPINFKWTFTPDDFNFENAYTLERIEGLSVRKVDYIVPGAVPPVFGSTYERTVALQENALYVWSVSDSNKDGLGLDVRGAELFLEKDDGTFESIYDEDGSFNEGMSYMFYATLNLDDVEDPYFGPNAFEDEAGAILEMEIEFDDYPWEFGLTLTTEDGETVIYRPPRYYFRQVGRSVTETFPVPMGDHTYSLTVVDTYGDGLLRGTTYYKITAPNGDVLVESQFRDSDREEKSFRYIAGGIEYSGSAHSVSWGLAALSSVVGALLYASIW